MQVAQGNVADHPFARTIFSLAAKRFTGDLLLKTERYEHKTSWENGEVVAASSPFPGDSPGRVALANGLVNSSTLGVFLQRLSEDRAADQVELLAKLANLHPDQTLQLKHRVLARSAARMFGMENAAFTVDTARSMKADPQTPAIDPRWLIYFGLRTHYSVERLQKELSVLEQRSLSLRPQAVAMLPAFGFSDTEAIVLEKLQTEPLSLPNLHYRCGLEFSTVACTAYALMACGYLTYGPVQAAVAKPAPPVPKPITPAPSVPVATARGTRAATTTKPPTPRTRRRPTQTHPAPRRRSTTAAPIPAVDKPEDALGTRALITQKLKILNGDANHYTVLGLPTSATSTQISRMYFKLARTLHPDRLTAIGVTENPKDVQRLFAAINKAFSVLSNAKSRAAYQEIAEAGGERAYAQKQAEAEEMAIKIFRAEEHFHLGEMALRRDHFAKAETEFAQACELNPNESEYLALHAWALYCNAADRNSVEGKAIARMSSAILKGPKSVTTRLYHAKLLKLMSRDEEARASFRLLLKMSPGHREGMLELRVLDQKIG